ncbi:Protein N-acetyltransferase, RimJ/RimL family [Microbispora rosea]|uniref:Protein N-acetyltransferase, RimJ/RimL family n=1 Tax=Microbispora rosea TaxID=58117 RepID=A0A1N7F8I1_9ACTN|nr:GNAT family N-acetyltransferase [Microbispora rosea]GIH49589.1 acetyltransferase [Microbispora rosea subsp. rosea]SIR96614.1 Protein N-acetyltransferase, RimJ/RimL family [Microbispora rosea]
METISAARLTLRPLTAQDADEMAEVLAGEELYAFIGGAAPTPPELRARYAALEARRSPDGRQEWLNWIIRRDTDGRAVGYVQATVADEGRRAEVAWVVGTAWQGRGYASEAAAALAGWLRARGVARIEAHIHPDHHASMAVAGRIGLLPTDRIEDGERLWTWDRLVP